MYLKTNFNEKICYIVIKKMNAQKPPFTQRFTQPTRPHLAPNQNCIIHPTT